MRRYSVVYAAVWARAPSRWAREGGGDQQGEGHDHCHGLAEEGGGFLPLALAQGEGAAGGGPHGEEDGNAGQEVDEGEGKVHAG